MLNEFPIFDYEDIQLIPNKCIISSRSQADTQVTFGKHSFKLPVVPANMQTIVDEELAEKLAREGYFYIMHRFDEAARIPFIQKMKEQGLISSISVGVKDYEYDFVSQLKDNAPDYITIDIAHGHADSVIKMIQHIKKELPETFVIAGNVGTPEAVRELENAGADATKVGIGPGKVCITKVKTG
ncbi:IMP dehydrogenase, partial [Streptococcus danieliae]|nr:IMP dehydrogenase [Streptococcus danieliae]